MTTNPHDEPDEIEALLPWYASGALDASGRRRVEEALASRPELRESLRTVEEDRDQAIALNESLGAPRAGVWTRVLAAAAAEPRRASLASRLAGVFGLGGASNPRRLAWIAAAAAIVIAVEGAAIVALLPSHSREAYRTASAEAQAGAEVLIAFAPDARIDQISAFLKERGASIEEGPRGGMYRVRIGDKRLTQDEMSALLKSLGASPLVRTALPAGGGQ